MNPIAAFVLILLLFSSAAFAQKPLDVEEYASLDQVTDEIARAIPVAEGAPKALPRIAVLPVRVDRAEVLTGLVQRLAGSGKFSVLDVEAVRGFLAGTPETGPAGLLELISRYKLDAVIAIRTYPSEGKQFIAARIFTSGTGPARATVLGLLDYQPAAAFRQVAVRDAPATGSKPELIPDLPLSARYVRVADLDGDGTAEYVFSDGSVLSVYRLEASGWKPVWKESGEKRDQGTDIALDIADADGNGRPEIYVTELRKSRAVSIVYEADGGVIKKIADVPGFLRAVRHPKQGTVLLGQDFDINTFFSGPVRLMAWKNSNLVKGDTAAVPKDVGLYDFLSADLGERAALVVSLSERRRLRIHAGETLLWESGEHYGGTATVAVEGLKDAYNPQRPVVLAGRMASVDLDGDGREEIIVPRDRASRMGTVKESELRVLAWTGARLDERRVIAAIAGAVLDFQIEQQPNGGHDALILVQEQAGLFSTPKPRLVRYQID